MNRADSSFHVPILDRRAAGQALVPLLLSYRHRADTIVLALPRGGVPVAYEIASALELPLDVLTVRKLGVPHHDELAMGAVASGGVRVLNHDVMVLHDINEITLHEVVQRELLELQRRERVYRSSHALPDLRDQQVILVDDGLATGATMRAAARAVRSQGAARITIAVPIAPSDTLAELREEVDEVVCPFTPEFFTAIGCWYEDFSQVSDPEVIDLLEKAWQRKLPESS